MAAAVDATAVTAVVAGATAAMVGVVAAGAATRSRQEGLGV
jgi:hypothetical protein